MDQSQPPQCNRSRSPGPQGRNVTPYPYPQMNQSPNRNQTYDVEPVLIGPYVDAYQSPPYRNMGPDNVVQDFPDDGPFGPPLNSSSPLSMHNQSQQNRQSDGNEWYNLVQPLQPNFGPAPAAPNAAGANGCEPDSTGLPGEILNSMYRLIQGKRDELRKRLQDESIPDAVDVYVEEQMNEHVPRTLYGKIINPVSNILNERINEGDAVVDQIMRVFTSKFGANFVNPFLALQRNIIPCNKPCHCGTSPRLQRYRVDENFIREVGNYSERLMNEFRRSITPELPAIVTKHITERFTGALTRDRILVVLRSVVPILVRDQMKKMVIDRVANIVYNLVGQEIIADLLPRMAKGEVICARPCNCPQNNKDDCADFNEMLNNTAARAAGGGGGGSNRSGRAATPAGPAQRSRSKPATRREYEEWENDVNRPGYCRCSTQQPPANPPFPPGPGSNPNNSGMMPPGGGPANRSRSTGSNLNNTGGVPFGPQNMTYSRRPENVSGGPANQSGGPANLSGGQPNYSRGPANQSGGPANLSGGQPNYSQGPANLSGGQPNYSRGPANRSGGQPNYSGGPANRSGGQPNYSGGPANQTGRQQNCTRGGPANVSGGQPNYSGGSGSLSNYSGGGQAQPHIIANESRFYNNSSPFIPISPAPRNTSQYSNGSYQPGPAFVPEPYPEGVGDDDLFEEMEARIQAALAGGYDRVPREKQCPRLNNSQANYSGGVVNRIDLTSSSSQGNSSSARPNTTPSSSGSRPNTSGLSSSSVGSRSGNVSQQEGSMLYEREIENDPFKLNEQ